MGISKNQVMADYTGELAFAQDIDDQAAAEDAKEQWRKRAIRYIAKSAEEQPAEKAPQKRKRMKAMHWGLALDNCISYATGSGLDRYKLDSATLATCPFEWASLTVIPDQGSDGFCMLNALQNGWDGVKFNVGVSWDKSHGAHNDVKLAIKRAGLWGFCLVAAVAAAAPHSPWNTGMRRIQTWEAMSEYLSGHDHDEELFVSVLTELLADDNESHRITEPNIAQLKWQELSASSIFEKHTTKLSLSRFQSVVTNARCELPRWTRLFLGTMYCAQQLGCVTEGLLDKYSKVQGSAPDQGKVSTARDEVKNLRRITTNNLAIAALYYSSKENKFKQAMLKHVCEPVGRWHTEQNKRLRSVTETRDYELQHSCGGWLVHIIDIFKKLRDYDALTECGLTKDLHPSWLQKGAHEGDVGLLHDHATTYGRLALSLVFLRIRHYVCVLFSEKRGGPI